MSEDPGRWWDGPLNVERLAMEAVREVVAAIASLGSAEGSTPYDVTTSAPLVACAFAALDHLRVDGRRAEGWAPLSGFVPAQDGWVRVHGNYPHHAAAVQSALGVSTRARLDAIAATIPAQELEETITAAGGVATVVRSCEEWLDHPQNVATCHEPWMSHSLSQHRDPRPSSAVSPLAGVRVLDFTRVIAGPTASQVLGCLGAEVLRIDPPGMPELRDQYISTGMGKRSTTLDLGASGARALQSLLGEADVVLIGYRPGSLDRFGLHPDSLRDRFPHLVVASLSAWGDSGPWATRRGFDSIVQAACGIARLYSGSDGRPGCLPVQALDHATGYRLAAAVIRALAQGCAGVIRASLLGAGRSLLATEAPPSPGPMSVLSDATRVIASPYGTLTLAPVPILVDGEALLGPVEMYGTAGAAFPMAPHRSR